MKTLYIPFIEIFHTWERVEFLNDFSSPWRKDTPPKTAFQAYHNDEYLHFKYTAFGPKPLVYVKTNHKLEVIHSERVEIFFRKNANLNPYYVFEIDPHGRVLDYKASHYRNFDRSWSWPTDLQIKTEIHEYHYTVQGQFKKTDLRSLGLLQNDELQVGLYRGHCTALKKDQANINWISWIDSGTAEPDFHVPSSFGKFILQAK
jgi:hypothetical protein